MAAILKYSKMKRYTILCTELTGVSGILTNGNTYTENFFVPGSIKEFLETKHIEEFKEPKEGKAVKTDDKATS